MFGLLRRKRHNPRAITEAILECSSDPETLATLSRAFSLSEDEKARLTVSLVIFAYCWGTGWCGRANDARVEDAFQRAGPTIASSFKGSWEGIPVSASIADELELSQSPFALSKYFRQHIPRPNVPDSDRENALRVYQQAIRRHEVRLNILVVTLMHMRLERMTKQIEPFAKLEVDLSVLVDSLVATLFEQVIGKRFFEGRTGHVSGVQQ